MRLEKGQVIYDLFDTENSTRLSWDSNSPPTFESDGLERVVHTERGQTQTFLSNEEGNGTIRGARTKEAIDEATYQYKIVRRKIYDEKRSEEIALIERAKKSLREF